jgi:hypothetical protein
LLKVLVAFNELPKIKINCPAANSWVLEWESITFAPRGGGLNPKRLLNKTLGWISRSHPPFLLITT